MSSLPRPKRILYIKAQGLGDMISGIPFLVEMKQQWHEVTQLFYDMDALMYLYDLRKLLSPTYRKALREFKKTPMAHGWFWVLELFREQKLLHDIVYIPASFWGMLCVAWKYYRSFDEAVVVINTKPARRIAYLCAKKTRIVFSSTNDTSTYRTWASGELEGKQVNLYDYHDAITWSTEPPPFSIPENYVTIFPSLRERTPEMSVWQSVLHFLHEKWIAIVVIWGVREQWFTDELKRLWLDHLIIDTLGKTNFAQMHGLVKKSKCNILCNGGVMWLANLVNPHNINIHTVSAFLTEPPVDEVRAFNVRPYTYPACKPCEAAIAPPTGRIPSCVFAGTPEEWACRKAIMDVHLIVLLKKLLVL